MNITLADIDEVRLSLYESGYVRKTPCIEIDVKQYFGLKLGYKRSIRLWLKLENCQTKGSFKIRGVYNQLAKYRKHKLPEIKGVITMSAGNYGRAFSFLCQQYSIPAFVFMPIDAPASREKVINGYGATVKRFPVEELNAQVKSFAKENALQYLHSYDDMDLIAGHASCGREIFEQVPDVSIVIVCCGGGGLISGISLALRHLCSQKPLKIFAAEPDTAASMHASLLLNSPQNLVGPKTVATGLAAPSIGTSCFEICSTTIDGSLLVSDDQIKSTMRLLYDNGFVVEPSGAAALAALLFEKLPPNVFDDFGDQNILNCVCVISGGNVTPSELSSLIPTAKMS